MILHGIEINPKHGETPTRARERAVKELYRKQAAQPVYVKVPPQSITPRVVGMTHKPGH